MLLVASTIFTLWARFSLGTMWSLSPNALRDHHQLRTDGPYPVTRHPIYTGLLGMLLGTTLLNGVGASISVRVVGIAAFAVRVSIEERLLGQSYGPWATRLLLGYRRSTGDYRQQLKWLLQTARTTLPGVARQPRARRCPPRA